MVSMLDVEKQLKTLGINFRFWGRAELRELPKILLPKEKINSCINGRYEDGFAMLCATDQRLLLVDKKPLFLNLLDLRFDMISEIDYGYRLLNASLRVCTPNKNFVFTSWRQSELRDLAVFIQQRIVEIRTHQTDQLATEENVLNAAREGAAQGFASFNPLSAMSADMSPPVMEGNDNSYVNRNTYARNPYTQMPMMSRQRVSRFGRLLIR